MTHSRASLQIENQSQFRKSVNYFSTNMKDVKKNYFQTVRIYIIFCLLFIETTQKKRQETRMKKKNNAQHENQAEKLSKTPTSHTLIR
ncbi:hypothetical protein MHK_002115 [Candidatus Magnetomorum sp. HK-1]|nr:hypothetical protein MHK_002115 [Candidatus Magnetomorum sp. HK-1]